jgi:hypothetical protein
MKQCNGDDKMDVSISGEACKLAASMICTRVLGSAAPVVGHAGCVGLGAPPQYVPAFRAPIWSIKSVGKIKSF